MSGFLMKQHIWVLLASVLLLSCTPCANSKNGSRDCCSSPQLGKFIDPHSTLSVTMQAETSDVPDNIVVYICRYEDGQEGKTLDERGCLVHIPSELAYLEPLYLFEWKGKEKLTLPNVEQQSLVIMTYKKESSDHDALETLAKREPIDEQWFSPKESRKIEITADGSVKTGLALSQRHGKMKACKIGRVKSLGFVQASELKQQPSRRDMWRGKREKLMIRYPMTGAGSQQYAAAEGDAPYARLLTAGVYGSPYEKETRARRNIPQCQTFPICVEQAKKVAKTISENMTEEKALLSLIDHFPKVISNGHPNPLTPETTLVWYVAPSDIHRIEVICPSSLPGGQKMELTVLEQFKVRFDHWERKKRPSRKDCLAFIPVCEKMSIHEQKIVDK